MLVQVFNLCASLSTDRKTGSFYRRTGKVLLPPITVSIKYKVQLLH